MQPRRGAPSAYKGTKTGPKKNTASKPGRRRWTCSSRKSRRASNVPPSPAPSSNDMQIYQRATRGALGAPPFVPESFGCSPSKSSPAYHFVEKTVIPRGSVARKRDGPLELRSTSQGVGTLPQAPISSFPHYKGIRPLDDILFDLGRSVRGAGTLQVLDAQLAAITSESSDRHSEAVRRQVARQEAEASSLQPMAGPMEVQTSLLRDDVQALKEDLALIETELQHLASSRSTFRESETDARTMRQARDDEIKQNADVLGRSVKTRRQLATDISGLMRQIKEERAEDERARRALERDIEEMQKKATVLRAERDDEVAGLRSSISEWRSRVAKETKTLRTQEEENLREAAMLRHGVSLAESDAARKRPPGSGIRRSSYDEAPRAYQPSPHPVDQRPEQHRGETSPMGEVAPSHPASEDESARGSTSIPPNEPADVDTHATTIAPAGAARSGVHEEQSAEPAHAEHPAHSDASDHAPRSDHALSNQAAVPGHDHHAALSDGGVHSDDELDYTTERMYDYLDDSEEDVVDEDDPEYMYDVMFNA